MAAFCICISVILFHLLIISWTTSWTEDTTFNDQFVLLKQLSEQAILELDDNHWNYLQYLPINKSLSFCQSPDILLQKLPDLESVVLLSWGVGGGVFKRFLVYRSRMMNLKLAYILILVCCTLGFPLRPISALNVFKLVSALKEGVINLYET